MPVPTSINGLSETPTSNSPLGTETVGTQANAYFQAAFAFIKQIADGDGLAPTSALNFNGQKVTNAVGDPIKSTSTTLATGAQVQAVYKVGEVKMWHGAVANIAAVWGAGWQLADGTNGTADLKDSFVIGAGDIYAVNSTGGSTTAALATANMPAHNHVINISDPSHNHAISQTPHAHAVSDPGHYHPGSFWGYGGSWNLNLTGAGSDAAEGSGTGIGYTGIGIQAQYANVSNNAAVTGITASSNNTGSGSSFSILPPYYALCFIEYTGIGA